MSLSRRELIRTASLAGVGTAATSSSWSSAVAASGSDVPALPGRSLVANSVRSAPRALFPPLESDPGDLLALPDGFSYDVVAVSGQTDIHDGSGTLIGKTPEHPDGTLVVRRSNRWRLIQNHEANPRSPQPVPHVAGTVYDAGAPAGGSTVIETTRQGQRISEWVALSGTFNNCAGGPTPWGSWLSCEETEDRAGTGTLEQDHGYVYEVFAEGPDKQLPQPIRAWGRYPHEAVVVHPGRRRVYLTEDAATPNGLLYRWTAQDGVRLKPYIAAHLGDQEGTLEAMAVHTPDGSVLPDLAYVTAAQIGRPFRTSWITVPDRLATTASVRTQFADSQVTRSRKLEGAWGDAHGAFFVASFATTPGVDLPTKATPHDGQLWYLDYREESLTLVGYCPYNPLLHSATSAGWEAGLGPTLDLAFDGLDGCHVSPYGSLILTEDGDTANHVLAWHPAVGFQAVARNLVVFRVNARGGNMYSEMTGPAFSPNGQILFSNVFNPGHVFAIRGPWRRYLA